MDPQLQLQLLLAHADSRRPVLEPGLPLASCDPPELPPPPDSFRDTSADPNSLPIQRWGIVAPEGTAGDRLLAMVERLRQARQADQEGAPPRVYRAPPALDAVEAARWRERVYRDEAVPETEVPSYLLVLGDLDQVSLELQQAMSVDAYVGRLAFARDEDYEAYADKVLRWERAPAASAGRLLFFTAHDGSAATSRGYQHLMRPCLASVRESAAARNVSVQEVGAPDRWSLDELLELAAGETPSALLSLTHGVGPPHGGWPSARAQRAQQGTMAAGDREPLAAADLAGRKFLPGGVWFYQACFSAGTARRSAYHHWLRRLQDAGEYDQRLAPILAGLAYEQPFVAALPQATLASPGGPLAVIGHVDLAWTSSHEDPETGRGRPSRFTGVLRAIAQGARAGVALRALSRFATEASVDLADLYDGDEVARQGREAVRKESFLRARLWMLRQDVSGYVLLGDPAVRLPVDGRREAVRPAPATLRHSKEVMEQAVLALLIGDASARDIAQRHGITISTLRRWDEMYRQAGRNALGTLVPEDEP